jgi:phage shock protein C
MYCTHCGVEMQSDHRFCAHCGKPADMASRPAWTPPPEPKRLERDMYQKKIAGVCAGFADYLGIDVTVMRLLWVGITLFSGAGLIAYPIAWLVMPRNDLYQARPATSQTSS